MAADAQETIRILLKTNQEKEETIADLRATIRDLRAAAVNLNETLDELKGKLFGRFSEKQARPRLLTGKQPPARKHQERKKRLRR